MGHIYRSRCRSLECRFWLSKFVPENVDQDKRESFEQLISSRYWPRCSTGIFRHHLVVATLCARSIGRQFLSIGEIPRRWARVETTQNGSASCWRSSHIRCDWQRSTLRPCCLSPHLRILTWSSSKPHADLSRTLLRSRRAAAATRVGFTNRRVRQHQLRRWAVSRRDATRWKLVSASWVPSR